MLAERAHHYLRHGLAATPVVLERLLSGTTPQDHDRRPDPERFTIREAVAHLADWEGVWLERMQRIKTEEPFLPGYDEGQWAIDHDYAHSDLVEQTRKFRDGRAAILAFLAELAPADWERTGNHQEAGVLTLESLAVMILGHDGYHLRQVTDFSAAPAQ